MLKQGEPLRIAPVTGLATLGVIVLNVALLYARLPGLSTLLSLTVLALLAWRGPREPVLAGGYLLMLGLALEALEGGIRKDSSTFSYYAVGAGLAVFALLALRAAPPALVRYFAAHGRNPLLPYVVGGLVVSHCCI